jgi:hypothetical protein
VKQVGIHRMEVAGVRVFRAHRDRSSVQPREPAEPFRARKPRALSAGGRRSSRR